MFGSSLGGGTADRVCRVLTQHETKIARAANTCRRTAPRSVTDAHATNLSRDRAELPEGMFGQRNMRQHHLRRHGMLVARCTVERLMTEEASRLVR